MNQPQRDAVRYLDGPLLVLAGAGSGKTRVITQKIAHLVETCGMDPRHIAAITFTNKAAREMAERVAKLMPGRSTKEATISTFHALGVRILRQEAKLAGLKPQFSILDAADAQSILADLSHDHDKAHLRALAARISNWKNAQIAPAQAESHAQDALEAAAAHAYTGYERALRAYQAVDFDDLIRLPVELFAQHPEARERWQGRLRYLLVDEYQDTNHCQYALLRLLAGPRAAFTAVGDDDQAIYAWRGADVANIAKLQTDYPSLKVIKLEQNYRSTGRILAAANSLIARNTKLFEKRLWSEYGPGTAVRLRACRDPDVEAEWVAMAIAGHKFEHRSKHSDYAVLYRGNYQSRAIEAALREQKIPYVVSGGQSFFDRAEIKDLLAYLRLIANSDDDPAFIRAVTTPRRGIGSGTLEALGQYAAGRHISLFAAVFESGLQLRMAAKQLAPLSEFCNFINRMEWRAGREPARAVLEDLLKAIGYETWLFESCPPREAESKWANVREFADWMGRKGEDEKRSLVELTQSIALLSMLDKDKTEQDAVQLATLHAAKGLEFKHVYLIGVEEGILPHRESVETGKLEEERRLMYVGVTRAERTLTLTCCERRPMGREIRKCEPSRFIAELGGDIQELGKATANTPQDRKANVARLEQLKALLAAKS
ncbi:MAG: UvrD-helicase domain-containing protein [Rhodocyclaceae bacterium]|nr:UvrD-helicase domain-containing protein [Rhodocyclaceae bacterium]MBX3669222.1 UvrD-helicase domain-containing protein [Rhodocyclaceae bacterium]